MDFSGFNITDQLKHGFSVLALMFLCAVLYWPGMDSPFLFDDAPNLAPLQHLHDLGPGDEGFSEFVNSGEAGMLGRPVSLYTFALQAEHWQENPAAFKKVNLLIHLLNGALVYFLALMLAEVAGSSSRGKYWVALTTTALWMLHPAHSSTVLYTVQRMTLLSTFGMLLALCGYLALRLYFSRLKPVLLLTGLMACGLISVVALFAKENAGSLLFYLLALEFVLLARLSRPPVFRFVQLVLVATVLAVVLIVVFKFSSLTAGYGINFDYGPVERLLTQARILWFLLLHSFLPGPGNTGLFVHFDISTGLLAPMITLPAVLGWCLVLALALWKRKSWPVFAFSVFWFLSGHLIESSFLPLEIFFNHRNYLAMLGPVFALVFMFEQHFNMLARPVRKLFPVAVILIFGMQVAVVAKLWGQPLELAARWVAENPEEERNQQFFASQLAANGRVEEALDYYAGYLNAQSTSGSWTELNYLILSCYRGATADISPQEIIERTRIRDRQDKGVVGVLRQLNSLVINNSCDPVTLEDMVALLTPYLSLNDEQAVGFVRFELAQVNLAQGNIEQALEYMDEAWEATGDAGILYLQAMILIGEGDKTLALKKVETALASLEETNILATGTRTQKRQVLNLLRDYLLTEGAQ